MKFDKELEKKYMEIFIDFENKKLSEDEVMLHIYLGEGLISENEFDEWNQKLEVESMCKKYKALFNYYKQGGCTLEQVVETIQILEKFYD